MNLIKQLIGLQLRHCRTGLGEQAARQSGFSRQSQQRLAHHQLAVLAFNRAGFGEWARNPPLHQHLLTVVHQPQVEAERRRFLAVEAIAQQAAQRVADGVRHQDFAVGVAAHGDAIAASIPALRRRRMVQQLDDRHQHVVAFAVEAAGLQKALKDLLFAVLAGKALGGVVEPQTREVLMHGIGQRLQTVFKGTGRAATIQTPGVVGLELTEPIAITGGKGAGILDQHRALLQVHGVDRHQQGIGNP